MIGERIKNRRQELGFSQVELAKKIGVSKQSLYKYENGIITNIPSDKIELLANVLRTTPGFLMGWESSTQNPSRGSAYQELMDFAKGCKPEEIKSAVAFLKTIKNHMA